MFVYWIRLPEHTVIGKQGYVGITNDVKNRWRQHNQCKGGSHHLYNAIKKYGDSLVYEIIYEGPEEGAIQLEEYWRPVPDTGWNIQSGGIYCKRSPETIRKIVSKTTGQKRSEEAKKRMSTAAKQVWIDHRETMLAAAVKVGEACKGRISPMKGKKHSEESKGKVTGLNNVRAKVADVYDVGTGNVVAKNVALGEWARSNGVQPSHLTATARGDRRTTGGFYARYVKLRHD